MSSVKFLKEVEKYQFDFVQLAQRQENTNIVGILAFPVYIWYSIEVDWRISSEQEKGV